jgi:hypothetical protein
MTDIRRSREILHALVALRHRLAESADEGRIGCRLARLKDLLVLESRCVTAMSRE